MKETAMSVVYAVINCSSKRNEDSIVGIFRSVEDALMAQSHEELQKPKAKYCINKYMLGKTLPPHMYAVGP
jgi:hypothetical protein